MDQASSDARRLTIWFTVVSTLAVLALLPFSKLSLGLANLRDFCCLLAIFLAFSIYCWKRGLSRLAPGVESVSVGIFLSMPALVSTYLAASLDQPLMDAALVQADSLLGLQWHSFIAFVDRHALLASLLQRAYSSFPFQLLALPIILSATGRYERAYVMVLAFGVLCYVSSFVSIWFPALGTYSVYGVSQDQLQNINAYYGFAFLHDFNAVREQPQFTLSLASASGIVTFPSVHAGGALVCAWAAWSLKPIRLLLVTWNVLMAVSAVSHANHYLVDVLAGAAIAALSIFAVTAILRRKRTVPSSISGSVGADRNRPEAGGVTAS